MTVKLPRARLALADARRALDELVDARNRPNDFRYRFRLCVAAVMAVGPCMNDELTGAPKDWWRPYVPQSPDLMKLREDTLKNAKVPFTGAEKFTPGPISAPLRPSRRPGRAVSRLVGPSITVAQSIVRDEVGNLQPSRLITGQYVYQWTFDSGPYAGQDPLTVLSSYLTTLETVLLPAAEAIAI